MGKELEHQFGYLDLKLMMLSWEAFKKPKNIGKLWTVS